MFKDVESKSMWATCFGREVRSSHSILWLKRFTNRLWNVFFDTIYFEQAIDSASMRLFSTCK
jgi:hypothetical protein